MTDKAFKIVNGDMSDGYHTFDELYEHRCLLFINLCVNHHPYETYWKADHYEGWDCLYLELGVGQISYHVPNKYRYMYESLNRDDEHEYDGHTSKDVIQRLIELATPSPFFDLPGEATTSSEDGK